MQDPVPGVPNSLVILGTFHEALTAVTPEPVGDRMA